MTINRDVLILDSTLREGEQAPDVRLTNSQRLQLAQALDDFGVNFIEVSTIVSEEHRELTRELVGMGLRANIVSHLRASTADIDMALQCDARWVALFLSTSDVHLESKLRMSKEQALELVGKTVGYAKEHGLKVRLTCEDAGRTGPDYLYAMCKAAQDAGVDRISVPDTIGSMTPARMGELVRGVRERVSVPLDLHCHNDLGLALANALAGLEAGASCVHTTINGVGERCGIVSLAEIVMALRVLYGTELPVHTEQLVRLSQMLSAFTGIATDEFKPVVGENAFRHKGGTHLAAVLKNSATYETFAPESVGNKRRLVLGEYSGKNVVKFLSDALGMELDEAGVQKAIRRLKEKNGDLFEFEV
ncbi:(R)-citramalate synthase CimA [Candidatus Burarchaeum australiense]|nr:(R)-citramalate synthase CimA [Candidatus Burarchaeum australiense]